MDRSGRVEPVDPLDPGWSVNPTSRGRNRGWAISPDGSRLAISVTSEDASTGTDIYVKRLPSGPPFPVSTMPGEQNRPRWTADGRWLTFISQTRPTENEPGAPTSVAVPYDLFRQRADGLGDPELVIRGAEVGGSVMEGLPGPDGWFVMRVGNAALDTRVDVVAMRPGLDSAATPLATSEFRDRAISLSPDGRWLAHESDETGRTEVLVRSFPDAGRRREPISNGGGFMPVWGRTGQELFYINAQRQMVATRVTLGEDLVVGESEVLFDLPREVLFSETDYYALYDVDVDDQRFLMLMADEEVTNSRLVVVVNWLDEALGRLEGG